VSAFWGGARNPDGSAKRPARFVGADARRERQRENERARGAKRACVRQRFLEHRDACEKLGRWTDPRKFEEWVLALATKVLDAEDETVVPEVCLPRLCNGLIGVHRSGKGSYRCKRRCRWPWQRIQQGCRRVSTDCGVLSPVRSPRENTRFCLDISILNHLNSGI
jgi:hypothetical protein